MSELATWLRRIADGMPDDGAVLLPVRELRARLGEVGLSCPEVDMRLGEVAEALKVSVSTVRGLCQRGDLAGYRRAGREWRVSRDALAAYQRAEAERHRRQRAGSAGAPRRPVSLAAWRREGAA